MKKPFTVDDFMVAFISALGYGFGEMIARLSGWPKFMCMAASFALGIALEGLISKIIFSATVQKSRRKQVCTYVAILLVFLAAQYVSIRWMGVSMLEYLEEEFEYVVILPVLGFFVNLLIRRYRIWKIRRLYGDGSEGFVFNIKKEDIEEANKQNQPILGAYDADCAVKTRTGVYVGVKNNKTICFLGIPYAKPPIGERRWKAGALAITVLLTLAAAFLPGFRGLFGIHGTLSGREFLISAGLALSTLPVFEAGKAIQRASQ